MVVTFENVTFKYIDKHMLKDANVSFTDNDKVGIVGVNGTGKSTLLKLICGFENPLIGTIVKSGNLIINYLEQNPIFENDVSIIDTLMKYSTTDFPINDYEAKSILNKLKLNKHNMLTTNLSGGESKRLALAITLVKHCDILILDEPTNHLDNDMIVWLEKYLIKWNKGLIMVTHDRYFLQRICKRIVEMDNGNIMSYQANYSRFLEIKEERLASEIHQQKKLKSILKKELEWIRRGPQARTTKSKSRIDRFNELNEIEFAKKDTLKMQTIQTRLGKKTIEIKHGVKAYGEKVLFQDFNFSLLRSDVVGFVGDNGSGKSTLFKIIMGQEFLDDGELILGETLKIGYFSQALEVIDKDIRVIDYIKQEGELIETLEGVVSAKSLLETFMFDSDMQYTQIKMLSGGEKRRLQLLRVLMTNPNVLILDEPTNDLDIYTLEILENYLETFHGPILVVSHDRYFLDKICSRLFIFEDEKIKEYMGTFSAYLASLGPKVVSGETACKRPLEKNKMTSKDRNELSSIEDDISKLEKRIEELSEEESKHLTNYNKLLELSELKTKISLEMDTRIERFIYLTELQESLRR